MDIIKTWRLIDTGLRTAAENIALNRVMLEARSSGETTNCLRFLRFRPSALLGYHQSAEQELDVEFCATHGIEVQRRISGGGAIYCDPGQLGWELYMTRADLGYADMQSATRRICETAARGIASLGIAARYRPRNDIEVGGKKISGNGGAFDGEALMFQGTLLVEFEVETMLRVLRIPVEKISDKAIVSARERVSSLADILGYTPAMDNLRRCLRDVFAQEFGVEFADTGLSDAEQARFACTLSEVRDPSWIDRVRTPRSERPTVAAVKKFPGGMLRAALAYDRVGGRIKQVWLSGDLFIDPRRTIVDLEAALRDIPAQGLESAVLDFFSVREVDMLGLAPRDFIEVIQSALDGGSEPIAVRCSAMALPHG
ncbi:MAG: lipoate--protein ligase family protein [Burkholderiales bacterium]